MLSDVLKPSMQDKLAVLWRALRTRDVWFKGLSIFIVLITLLAGLTTYILLNEQPILTGQTTKFYWLVALDIILLLALSGVVGWRGWLVWRRRRQKLAGANLHIQLTAAFSVLTVIPAILVAIFAVVFIHVGVQAWFGSQIRTAVTESQEIARSYMQEHQQSIRADMLAMASDLNRESLQLMNNKIFLKDYFKTQAYLRNLSEALLLNGSGKVITRAGISLSLEFMKTDFKDMIERAHSGEVVMFIGENEDRVRAMVKLDNFVDAYLFVGRLVDENVISHVSMTNKAVMAYQDLEARQAKLKFTMTLIFILVTLMLLLVAIWAALTLAERIVEPVSRLVEAAERVRSGDLNARVDEDDSDTEINILARAFNRMTDQLSTQRRDLINTNRLLDERRRFSETVLAGVNAGILAMDEKGVIQIANASAQKLLKQPLEALVGKRLADICPEMEVVRRVLRSKNVTNFEIPIDIDSVDPEVQSHWIVRMTADGQDDAVKGYVTTFDDLSPLIDAQRKAAWSDVARRVAHEIKNPLTPIQLSAERLRKRYSKQIHEDLETFEACTDTIIRHVDDIRHMVDEFSAFARMPIAAKNNENLVTLCQQAIVLFQQAHQDVQFIFERPENPVWYETDRQQVTQALTNILKNAYEALSIQTPNTGIVRLSIIDEDERVTLRVVDNGPGWPTELMNQLTDPYITTKNTGTGLGLAIVKKIVEDHQGRLVFKTLSPQGAQVDLIFPRMTNKEREKKNG